MEPLRGGKLYQQVVFQMNNITQLSPPDLQQVALILLHDTVAIK